MHARRAERPEPRAPSDTKSAIGQPIFGVELYVGLASWLVTLDMPADASGLGTAALPLQPIPAFAGLAMYAQTISLDPCATPVALSASQGLRMLLYQP
ncbi:MAG TPA: hypothetical protein VKE69_02520 [Planctomycetota bacterium]|nr:hypothetical protein [Planctomycetota bacterium]